MFIADMIGAGFTVVDPLHSSITEAGAHHAIIKIASGTNAQEPTTDGMTMYTWIKSQSTVATAATIGMNTSMTDVRKKIR